MDSNVGKNFVQAFFSNLFKQPAPEGPLERATAGEPSQAGRRGWPRLRPRPWLEAECFTKHHITAKGKQQSLAAVGSRHWGHPAISSLIRVKIYDFALYMSGEQAAACELAQRPGGLAANLREGQSELGRELAAMKDVDMTLLVRASRNLPIQLLVREYEGILKRRLKIVSHSAESDPALQEMLDTFRGAGKKKLPKALKDERGTAVKKGTLVTFERSAGGEHLYVQADKHGLCSVRSPHLPHALFHTYLADNPVSVRARTLAGRSFKRLVEGPYALSPEADRLVCQG